MNIKVEQAYSLEIGSNQFRANYTFNTMGDTVSVWNCVHPSADTRMNIKKSLSNTERGKEKEMCASATGAP